MKVPTLDEIIEASSPKKSPVNRQRFRCLACDMRGLRSALECYSGTERCPRCRSPKIEITEADT